VFCIRHKRIADGYRKVSFSGLSFQIPGVDPHDDVELHLIPDESKNLVEVRFWAHDRLLHSLNIPISSVDKSVHF